MFGVDRSVELPFAEDDLTQLATTVIQHHSVVTGVQPKLSLHVPRVAGEAAHQRFTIVGVRGDYIIKPPSERYPELPQIEDVTMHLAQLCAIATVPHSLIRMTSGNLAYITDAATFGGLKTKQKDAGSGMFVLEGGQANGYNVIRTQQATAGNVYFGNFSDMMIGMWGGLDLTVDPYTASTTGTVRVVALQTVDVAVRNAVSFAWNNDGV
jgi:hypothetical protein